MSTSPLPTNANFQRVVEELKRQGDSALTKASGTSQHQAFIARFPADRLTQMSLTDYCVGRRDGDSFCWWLERGLEPVLGRYMPGTSRGHILYFKKDGSVYKNRDLAHLSDEAALRYTLAIQAAIAQVGPDEDWRWIDDDGELYRRAGVEPLVTVGNGRKLRLLSAYHPDEAIPINSSRHVGHFLEQLGCPPERIPAKDQPVARMLLLREYLRLAQAEVSGISPASFMRMLYQPDLGLAPEREEEEDEGLDPETTLAVVLTEGAISNGYLRIPKRQQIFPPESIAADEKSDAQHFELIQPDGQAIRTCLVAHRGRLKQRFYDLFRRLQPISGDRMVIHKLAEGRYEMTLERKGGGVQAEIKSDSSSLATMKSPPLNQILFGPPGTGKTFGTIDAALEILDKAHLSRHRDDRSALKARFDELVQEGRVEFVTFHQSFSYEDFVEGLQARLNDEGQLEYSVEPGVFKRLCDEARPRVAAGSVQVRPNARVWKLSIAGTGPSPTKAYCLAHDEARIGWGRTGDLAQSLQSNEYYESLGNGDRGTLRYFAEEIAVGDVVLCIHSAEAIAAVGVVTGDYRYEAPEQLPAGLISDYQHVRPVKWLYTGLELPIAAINDGKNFTLKTVYQMNRLTWADLHAYLEQQGCHPVAGSVGETGEVKPYVLVIDEINRGNISRIFGELITLIEPSKRAGARETLEAVLPYSKRRFSVPQNLYLIGTMNTADRSLTGMDVALRRRFVFKAMPPRPELLDQVRVQGVPIAKLLEVMNQRIEALLDREHCLGHAYFMPLKEKPELPKLAEIFREQVLPLLQEYFYDDWQRIQWVLNDHRKAAAYQFISSRTVAVEELFGSQVNVARAPQTWQVNDEAFDSVESYLGVIDHRETQDDE